MALDAKRRLSFGIKTSQAGVSYQEWLEADGIPLFEHAWLWDHMGRIGSSLARNLVAGGESSPGRRASGAPVVTVLPRDFVLAGCG